MHRGSRLSAQYAPQQRPASHAHAQQTAAGPASQQQQQQGTAGAAGGGGGTGGRVLEGGVPPLLLAKGYDVLGAIGEVRRELRNCESAPLPPAGAEASACCRSPLPAPVPLAWHISTRCALRFSNAGHIWARVPGTAPLPARPLFSSQTHEAAARAQLLSRGWWLRLRRWAAPVTCSGIATPLAC